MTEEDGQAWIMQRWPAAKPALTYLAECVRAENERQNLIARSTVDRIWTRHVVDSAQLAILAPVTETTWIDVGTGGGFPGLVCAILRPEPFILAEPRRKRADFLQAMVDAIGLKARVAVHTGKIEGVAVVAGTISARAVGSISTMLAMCAGCIVPTTTIVLPRGRVDHDDVAQCRLTWDMVFHVEHSVTDFASEIALISQVKRK